MRAAESIESGLSKHQDKYMTDSVKSNLSPEQLFENNRKWAASIRAKDADFFKN